ncbi:MAG: anti-sigma factor family protein [Candidatus Zixiibacteriota bacterium]
MNCQEVLNLLYDIIDKEASEIDVREVEEHLKTCKDCFGVYEVEKKMQVFLNEKLKNADNAPTPRLNALRANVLKELDKIDSCPNHNHEATHQTKTSPKKPSPPFFGTTRILAVAAAVVIIVAAGFFINSLFHHDEYYIPLERAHWNAGGNLTPFKNVQHLYAALTHVSNDMHYKLDQKVKNFQLIGGQNTEIMQANMTHFVYADSSEHKIVSVFVVPAKDMLIDEELKNHEVKLNGTTFYDHYCRGCRLVFHQVGDLMIITATTEKNIDLLDFIPGQQAI